jgi:hypothetical protein
MMTNWVETFFADYAAAFHSDSKRGLLAKFCVPLTFLTKDGAIVLGDKDCLAANMDALSRRYEQLGASDWQYTIRRVQAVGAGIHLIEIEWRFFNVAAELLYACATSYFLGGETAADAKVLAIIAHNEHEEYQKAWARKQSG